MAKRRRKEPPATVDYVDSEGNVLTVRELLTAGSVRKIAKARARGAATVDDDWRRRTEMLFERLVVRWEIAGLPMGAEAAARALPHGGLGHSALGAPHTGRARRTADS